MGRYSFGWIVAGLLGTSGVAMAHHSFAMFDQENQVEMIGIVQEFRFSAPHTFIILEVKQEDGSNETWSLEGVSPSALTQASKSNRSPITSRSQA